ncbi:hypothetical protein CRYUN_Cryun09bG0067900 [Craigia yunnanensis]
MDSTPSSLLANFTDSLNFGINKGGFDSDRLISRFMNSSHGDNEIEDKSGTEAAVNYVNSRQSYSGLPPHYPRQSSATSSSAMNSSYELLGMDHHSQGKPVSSSLTRQSSLPPGLSTNLSVQNGYARMKGLGNYCGISEIGNESIGANSPDDGKLGNSNNDARFCGTGYQYGSWNDSAQFTENFSGLKRTQDNDRKFFSANQNGGLGSRVHVLSHHLSLPKTSNEMVAMEKFLHFQDSVPCKIRANRGCATHPRSIAERVRRARISERMRKLQELVPNMDKTFSNNRANCKCLNIQKPVPNQIV